MRKFCAHLGLALALAACATPSHDREELETVKRVSIEALLANKASLLGKTVELRGYVRAGNDGADLNCDIGKHKGRSKNNKLVFLNSPICVNPNPRDYKEGMATVRGVVFSRYPDSGEFSIFVFGRIYSSELKDVSIEWD